MTFQFAKYTWSAKDSDHKFTLIRRSPMAIGAFSNMLESQRPKPPTVRLSNGSRVENPADPAYAAELQAFSAFKNIEITLFTLSAVVEEPTEAEIETIAEMMGGVELDKRSRKMIWLEGILSPRDYNDLVLVGLQLNQVTEDGIAEATAEFRNDNQRSTGATVPTKR
jgi:hypothetical protein